MIQQRQPLVFTWSAEHAVHTGTVHSVTAASLTRAKGWAWTMGTKWRMAVPEEVEGAGGGLFSPNKGCARQFYNVDGSGKHPPKGRKPLTELCMIPFIQNAPNWQIHEDRKMSGCPGRRGRKRRKWRRLVLAGRDGHALVSEHVKCHQIRCFPRVLPKSFICVLSQMNYILIFKSRTGSISYIWIVCHGLLWFCVENDLGFP